MSRDEIERLKREEKAHLRQIRALQQQLREARRQRTLTDALGNLDTVALDAEFERALRSLRERALSDEARLDLALEALEQAEARERHRLERAHDEAEERRARAEELVRRLRAELADAPPAPCPPHAPRTEDPLRRGASQTPPAPLPHAKTIGRPRPR